MNFSLLAVSGTTCDRFGKVSKDAGGCWFGEGFDLIQDFLFSPIAARAEERGRCVSFRARQNGFNFSFGHW